MPNKKQKLFSKGLEYEILFCFKQNKSKRVFKALKKDPVTGFQQEVLIKVVPKPQAIEEFKSLSQVASPYCVRLLGFENFGDEQALILESIKGVSLFQLLNHYRLKQKEKDYLIHFIYKGLQDLNQCGLSHGDLSLDNVLLDEKAHIKLIDFGRGNYEKGQFYTLAFVAPEIKKGFRPCLQSDLYSLGVISEFFNNPHLLDHLKSETEMDFYDIQNKDKSFAKSSHNKSSHNKDNPLLSLDPEKRIFKESPPIEDKKVLKSLSIKVKEILAEMEFRQCETIRKKPSFSLKNLLSGQLLKEHALPQKKLALHKLFLGRWLAFLTPSSHSSSALKTSFLILAFFFLTGSQPSSKTPYGLVKIYTHKWFFVKSPLVQSYTPFIFLAQPGWHKMQWENNSSEGEKRFFVSKKETLVLNDNFFQN